MVGVGVGVGVGVPVQEDPFTIAKQSVEPPLQSVSKWVTVPSIAQI
jgi:hypothetical protein